MVYVGSLVTILICTRRYIHCSWFFVCYNLFYYGLQIYFIVQKVFNILQQANHTTFFHKGQK